MRIHRNLGISYLVFTIIGYNTLINDVPIPIAIIPSLVVNMDISKLLRNNTKYAKTPYLDKVFFFHHLKKKANFS